MEETKVLAKASLYFLRQSPHKVRLVADLVRGRRVNDALAILRFSKQRAGGHLLQLLRSAVANLQQKEEAVYDEERLFISRLLVDGGPTMKRFKAMSMGRAGARRKRTSRILMELGEQAAKKQTKAAATKLAKKEAKG